MKAAANVCVCARRRRRTREAWAASSPPRRARNSASNCAVAEVTADDWDHAYTRQQAGYPEAWHRADKYWSPVSRIDGVYGDRHVVCSCPPMEELEALHA